MTVNEALEVLNDYCCYGSEIDTEDGTHATFGANICKMEEAMEMARQALRAQRESPKFTEFIVVDAETGRLPDCERIAINEEWAKGLIPCDIDCFCISEDGRLLLMDECGNVACCPHDRFKVVFLGGDANDDD